MTHRYYDAGKGRFLTRDPIGYGGGINLYGFVGNNPVTGADPSGFRPMTPGELDGETPIVVSGPWVNDTPSDSDEIRTDIALGLMDSADAFGQNFYGPSLELVGDEDVAGGDADFVGVGGVGGSGDEGARVARELEKEHARIAAERLDHTFDEHAPQWFGRKVMKSTDLEPWRDVIERASRSKKVFRWSTKGEKTVAHLARIDGKNFVVQYFAEGTLKGHLATAFRPGEAQMRGMLRALGKARP